MTSKARRWEQVREQQATAAKARAEAAAAQPANVAVDEPVAPVVLPASRPAAVIVPAPKPEPANIDDDQKLVLEELTREHVIEWRARAAHDHQVVFDHIDRYLRDLGPAPVHQHVCEPGAAPRGSRALGPRLHHLGAGMSGGETSGVDLARVALRAAMQATRKNGSGQKTKRKPRAAMTVPRDGREPMGLGAAIGALVTERAWELPAAGAMLRERWAAIAPELAGHVAAVSYDPDSGRLTVCPESAAWATKARLEQTRIIAAANESAGRTVVRSLQILAPVMVPVPEPADVTLEPAVAPAGPPGTQENASDGYRRAPGGGAAVAGGPAHRGSGGAADRCDAEAVPPRVPPARRRVGRCVA
ncbi:DUF721 domain-containing protein [Streptomyces pilosus]|uniref:DUF721 domain-containing protein n=1 Tax=Streptomyces pilosus TaxID=28893 RepID=UPI00370047C0